MTGFWR